MMDSPTAENSVREASQKDDDDDGMRSARKPQISGPDRTEAQERKPFEVVLRGGAPWGFALSAEVNSGIPLHISKIVAGGKASESALMEGDYMLQVNDVQCSDVGQALDIMDTAADTLTITVLRGQWDSLDTGKPKLFSPVAWNKERSSKHSSDDSVLYSQSKSRQLKSTMRSNKHRGSSFNVGKRNIEHLDNKFGSIRGQAAAFPQSPSSLSGPHRPTPYDAGSERWYSGYHRLPVSHQHKETLASMNRRRSEGPVPQTSSSIAQKQHLLSMKSTPNLTGSDDCVEDIDSPHEVRQLAKSSPNLLDDANKEQQYLYTTNIPAPSSLDGRQIGYRNVGGKTYSADMYTSDMSPSRQDMPRSLPAHTLLRYHPDYENVTHLGMAPLQSEKISEIDDIDEVTGKESSPHTPDIKEYDPLRGAGLPTRDPASLKYIKVNQSHEKYPSWPVTKASGPSDQAQSINSRAQSVTDHTNTSKEFPKKQQLAYTPGLRPLPEKNCMTTDDGKARNSSDPGLKSEFVFDRSGRVRRRNVADKEDRFEDFYNNSKPGYPPPNMDPDGHNIGDKEYNAPSPPERDGKGISQQELSYLLESIDGSRKSESVGPSLRAWQDPESFRPSNQLNILSESKIRPADLNLSKVNAAGSQNLGKLDSGTSPLDKGSPLSHFSQRDPRSTAPAEVFAVQQNRQQWFHDKRHNTSQPARQDRGSPQNTQGQSSHFVQVKSSSLKSQISSSQIQRDRASSGYSFPTHSNTPGSLTSPNSGDASKTYIVRSTPYYNTSTQTEMIPYAIKLSDPASGSTKLKHAEIQVDEFAVQTSSKAQEEQRKMFEEKSIQARMSRDFQSSELDVNVEKPLNMNKKQNEDFFRYPSSLQSTSQPSPFKGIQSIQAKYATDEHSDDAGRSKSVTPTYSDNASILRKLSEEFYGQRLGLVAEKRSASGSSQESPLFDLASSESLQQPGLREAESYSSVVIHHEEKSGPFGRDDFGSMSSMAESRHDTSLVFSDSGYKKVEATSVRGRRSLDLSSHSQKARFHQHDQKLPSSMVAAGQSREAPGSIPVTNAVAARGAFGLSSGSDAKVHNVSKSSSASSETSSISQNSRSSSLDARSSQSMSLGSGVESPLTATGHISSSSASSSVAVIQGKQVSSNDQHRNTRAGSDSVFIEEGDKEAEDLSGYEFYRKPSMRKAYGIYDETERLISQTKAGKSPSEHSTKPPGQGGSCVPTSRVNRYQESQGLGKIQEETDVAGSGSDLDRTDTRRSASDKFSKADEIMAGWKQEKQKYPWQNEAWLRNNVDISRSSNLKRAASEQMTLHKHNPTQKPSSHDTNFPGDSSGNKPFSSLYDNHANKASHTSSSLAPSVTHSRIKSEDLSYHSSEFEQTVSHKQEASGFKEYRPSSKIKDTSSLDSSLYEPGAGNRSSSDSVAEVITQVNENLAKSARRVDSIRRSNSSSSRSSSDYMDMSRLERSRKETDWSRLRSSGSLRYSPDPDRGSSRSSFASENPYEDISLFSPSTPRSSYAENKDVMLQPTSSKWSYFDFSLPSGNMNEHPNYYLAPQRHKFVQQQQQQQQQARRWTRREYNLMQGRGASPTLELTSSKATFYIVNSSVDSGLVSSPTYQNLPCQRRPPPPPPRSPSPELKPPVLPPRKYRESQQSSIMEKSVPSASVSLQNSTKPSAFPTEKNRISVIPLHKLQSEENQVDSTKRDFKSLMTQWENSSPREDNYAAELRKQAKKFSGTQQQPNSIPAAYERTKPKISFATTYKHEPMQPQEATSPVSSSFTAFTASQLPSTVSNSSMPSSSSLPPSGYKTSNISASLSQGVPSASSNTHHQHTKLANTPRNVPVVNSMGYTAPSSSPGTVAQTKSPEKTKVPDDYRNRSSSDVAHDKHQASEGPYLSGQGLSTTTRDRSSSDHDILSERRPQNQSFQASAKQAPQTVSKWLPGRGAPEHQPTKPQARSGQLVEIVSMTDARHPTQGFETVQNLEETLGFDKYGDNERFADESYIGHKNKSSRAIGTYKRSKSAVLQSGPNNNNYQVAAGDEESSAFQEQKLGQQPWSSESVLSRTDEPGAQVGAAGGDRFAKPSVHGRHSVGQPPVSSSISQSNSPSSVPSSAPPGIFTYRPFVKEQPSSGASRESQRHAASSALVDPSFDSSKSSSRGKVEGVPRSTNSFQMPGEDAQRKHFNNPSGHSPQRWNSSADDLKSTQIWNPPGNSYAEKSLPSSSQDGILHSRSSGYSSLNSDSARSTQNIYQRRDSSPIKSASPASSPVSKLGAPSEDLNSISRRCSDSGISSTQRSEYSCHDVSTTSHSRQPSQEELECDEKAMQLAQELEDKDQKLSEVLRSDANKKRMQYMNGLFSESMEEPCQVEKSSVNQETRASVRTARSPRHSVDESIDKESSKRGSLPKEYWMSPSKALLEMELRKNEEASKDLTKDISDSKTLMKHKEELMEKLHKKLIVLKEEKVSLQQEVSDNNLLGQQVCLVIDAKCQSHSERDKFKTCIDDLEKIVRLLLNLSGQLARAQNAVQALRPDADAKVKKLTIDKRERLSAKHEEAKLLKEDIDKRSEQLAGMLRERLNDKEFSDYTHFVKMKSKLTIDMQELDDKITLGEEQILELRKSIPDVAES